MTWADWLHHFDPVADWIAAVPNKVDWIAVLVAWLALCVSYSVAWHSKKAANALMLHAFLSDYAKPEMFIALQVLRVFWEDNGNLVHELKRLHTNIGEVDESDLSAAQKYVGEYESQIGTARRHVHSFYKRGWRLWKHGYLRRSDLRIIADSDGFELLRNVARPLSMAVNLVVVHEGDIQAFRRAAGKFKWYDELAAVGLPQKRESRLAVFLAYAIGIAIPILAFLYFAFHSSW
jgi:hypothetical protein